MQETKLFYTQKKKRKKKCDMQEETLKWYLFYEYAKTK